MIRYRTRYLLKTYSLQSKLLTPQIHEMLNCFHMAICNKYLYPDSFCYTITLDKSKDDLWQRILNYLAWKSTSKQLKIHMKTTSHAKYINLHINYPILILISLSILRVFFDCINVLSSMNEICLIWYYHNDIARKINIFSIV